MCPERLQRVTGVDKLPAYGGSRARHPYVWRLATCWWFQRWG